MFLFNKCCKNHKEVEIDLWKRGQVLDFRQKQIEDERIFWETRSKRLSDLNITENELKNKEIEKGFREKEIVSKKADNEVKLAEITNKYEAILKEKDKVISELNDWVKVLLTKIPTVNLEKFNFTINQKEK